MLKTKRISKRNKSIKIGTVVLFLSIVICSIFSIKSIKNIKQLNNTIYDYHYNLAVVIQNIKVEISEIRIQINELLRQEYIYEVENKLEDSYRKIEVQFKKISNKNFDNSEEIKILNDQFEQVKEINQY